MDTIFVMLLLMVAAPVIMAPLYLAEFILDKTNLFKDEEQD